MAGLMIAGCAAAQEKPAAPAAAEAMPARPVTPIQKVVQAGTGPIPMVLVPDIGFDWTVWKTFMERNGERYSMYAVTLPGFDKTEAPELRPGENWEAMVLTTNSVAAIARLIEEKKIDHPVVVGHGYGGHIAMRVALDHPKLVRSIVSVDGLPVQPLSDPNQDDSLGERRLIVSESLAPKMKLLTDQEWHDRHFAAALSIVTDQHRANELAAMLASQDRGVYSFFLFESILSDVRPQLKSIRVPMFCIAPISPEPPPPPQVIIGSWTHVLGAPPGAWLSFYPNCRHFVMDDNPQQLDADIAFFVNGQDIPGAQKSPTPIVADEGGEEKPAKP